MSNGHVTIKVMQSTREKIKAYAAKTNAAQFQVVDWAIDLLSKETT